MSEHTEQLTVTAETELPVLQDIVPVQTGTELPILDLSSAVTSSADKVADMDPATLIRITDSLELALGHDLDRVVEEVISTQLQTAIRDMATTVKKHFHERLRQTLPPIIEASTAREDSSKT
jgi:hypothetical protein